MCRMNSFASFFGQSDFLVYIDTVCEYFMFSNKMKERKIIVLLILPVFISVVGNQLVTLTGKCFHFSSSSRLFFSLFLLRKPYNIKLKPVIPKTAGMT